MATPRPQVTSVVDEGSITDLAANDGWFLGFTLTGSGTGTIAVIVDWTFASNDVDVYLAEAGACSGHFFPDECSFVNSAGSLAKPERIEAPDLRAGEYQVLIINWGTTTEAVSYQILLTTSAGTSSGRGLLSVVQASGPHGEYLREGAES